MLEQVTLVPSLLIPAIFTFADTSHSESNIQMEIKRPDLVESKGLRTKERKEMMKMGRT